MNEEMISKKELLELTGISYGQLYRWKRKNLIPEEWFIRKSTYTGQETFFPKSKILARIDKIKNMKEDVSLDDLADMLSTNAIKITMSKEELKQQNIVSIPSLNLYIKQYGDKDSFSFEDILYVYILDKLILDGEINLDEGKMVLGVLKANYSNFSSQSCDLIFIRKLGISTCLLTPASDSVYFEPGVKVVSRLNVTGAIEELKIKLINGGASDDGGE